ncbi:MAG: LamG-like jellyroll fold domain-containing protein [Ferruginibacter sp.]
MKTNIYPHSLTALKTVWLRSGKLFLLQAAFLLLAITSFKTSNAQATGQTLSFDAVNDSVFLPVRLQGSYTKEVWINTSQFFNFPNIISGTGTALFINGGQLAAGHAPFFSSVIDPTPLPSNVWVHVAVTYDSVTGVMNLYKNGVLVSTGAAPAYVEPSLRLGTFNQSSFYGGLMDEVRLWSVARTQAQISANMNCGLTGDEFFLLAYYRFNQGIAGGSNPTETTLRDTADNCVPKDGTLFNFALNGPVSNFVAPGAPVAGTCAGSFANILISGNSVCITTPDSTASTVDGTIFGSTTINTNLDKTFTITNTGNANLDLTAPLAISGPNFSLFTVITAPAILLVPGASTTFTVRFNSPTAGTFNAFILASNTDGDEGAFSFAIQATATFVAPVTLVSFDGKMVGSSVKLTWKTSGELNNKGFEILRSDNSQLTFTKIGFVAGTNLSLGSNYELTDYAPLNGINTYKLRQVDIDGRASFSNTVVVNNNDNSVIVSAYPNPFEQSFNIIFNDAKLLNTVANVRSVTGKTVAVITLKNYRQEVNLSGMTSGVYIISFSNGEVMRLIKK